MAMTDIFSPAEIASGITAVEAVNPFDHKEFFKRSGLSSKSAEQVKLFFDMLDINGSGFIEETEILIFLRNLKADARLMTPAETAEFMKAGDPNNTGKIGPDGALPLT
ncbi:parvalbumin beta-like [Anomaloglossus baeobatrachus]|uniref:parvalbumin beta-like n=1 Tax=Anomaloglossus baeobatrachus TaxID=238106 RepID=UPI003F5072EA